MKAKIILFFIALIMAVLPLAAQTVTETDTLTTYAPERIYKDTNTDNFSYGSNYNIGKESISNEVRIYRGYFVFDIDQIGSLNNVTIDTVKLMYHSSSDNHYQFYLTGPTDIIPPSSVIDDNDLEFNWDTIGESDTLETDLDYEDSEQITISENTRSYLTANLSEDVLYIGVGSLDENTDGSVSNISLDVVVTYSYDPSYAVTVRNDFNGQYGGQVGVGKNTSPTSKNSPFLQESIQNGDQINLEAYDNQTIDGYTWVFNESEAPENKSRWAINKSGNITTISSNQSTSRTANNDKDAIIYNEQKRIFTITRNDYSPEADNTFNTDNVQVVEGNTLTAPSTQTVNGTTYTFFEWSDGVTAKTRTIDSPTPSLTAHYKGIGLSTDDDAYTDNSQRRFVQTAIDGEVWLHRVYASMGHIWLEHSNNGGSTWTLGNNGKSLDGDSDGAKNPSVAHTCDDFNPGEVCHVGVVWQEKYGTKYKVKGKMFTQFEGSTLPGYGTTVTTLHTEPSDHYTVNAHPNLSLTTEVGSPYLITFERKSTSGNYSPGINWLVGYVTGGGVAGPLGTVQEKGVISGTDASTLHAQPSLASSEQHQIGVNVIRQQGTGSSGKIYAHFISLTDIGPFNNIENSDWQVFQYDYGLISYPDYSWSPSIVTYPTSTQGSTGYFSACWTEYGLLVYLNSQYPTIMYNLGNDVGSCSIASDGGTQGFMVWSEQPGANWVNKSIRFSGAFLVGGTAQTLSTQGKYVQVANSATSSLSNMYVSSFSPVSVPYYFETSGTLGPVSKQKADETVESRGFMLTLGNGKAAFKYRFGELNIDGKNILFVETPDTADYGVLETLNSALLTEPFQVEDHSEIVFSEASNFAHPDVAEKAFGNEGFIRYKIELVEEATKKVLGTIREKEVNASAVKVGRETANRLNTSQLAGKTVRAKVTLETNMVNNLPVSPVPEGVPDSLKERAQRPRSNLVLIKHYSGGNQALEKAASSQVKEIHLQSGEAPKSYALGQNYPNPFNPTTQITYQLPQESMVRLEVYDLLGRRVQMLVNDRQKTGRHHVSFDASSLASGVYIYRLQAGDFVQSRKLFLIK